MERGDTKRSACQLPVATNKNKLQEERRSAGVTNSTARHRRRQEWAKKQDRTHKKRNGRGKPDDTKETAVDAKDEISLAQPPAGEPEGKRRRKKLVTQGLVDYIVGVEVVDYMLGEPLRLVPDEDSGDVFGIGAGVSALIMEGIEENADVLRLFRTGKHTLSSSPTKIQATHKTNSFRTDSEHFN